MTEFDDMDTVRFLAETDEDVKDEISNKIFDL